MNPAYCKAKGREAEHDVIAPLQEWWRRVEPAAVFFRTPRSGGWSNAAATGMKTRGDLCYDPTTCSRFPFSVEVKNHKTIIAGAIERFVADDKSSLEKFWNQCVKAAALEGLAPLLVFRGNRMPFRVAYLDEDSNRHVRLLSTFLTNDPNRFLLYKPELAAWSARCRPSKSTKTSSERS